MSLTDTACRNAKPKDKKYKLSDSGGLYLEITPSGGKLWQWKYYMFKKEKKLSLGKYPQVSLAEAREARDNARKLKDANIDPSLAKQEKKRMAAASAADTFGKLALEWHEKEKPGWSENHADTVMRRLERDIIPELGNLPISQITTPRVAAAIDKIGKRGSYDVASRCLQYCRKIFTYGKFMSKLEINPAEFKAGDILSPVKKGHFAAMDASQLPDFLNKLHRNESRMMTQTQLAMEFMMLTFVRTKEMRFAEWKEIDFEKRQWRIPAYRMKMKEAHIVPLSRQALIVLEKLKRINGHRELVFSGQRDPRKPISDNLILMALDRMGYRGIHTGHGFRALAMTICIEELGYDYEVPNLQLAHSKGDSIRRAYDRTKFLDQRTKMMQDWADYLDKVGNINNVIVGNFNYEPRIRMEQS